jgi:hypothetical protein
VPLTEAAGTTGDYAERGLQVFGFVPATAPTSRRRMPGLKPGAPRQLAMNLLSGPAHSRCSRRSCASFTTAAAKTWAAVSAPDGNGAGERRFPWQAI